MTWTSMSFITFNHFASIMGTCGNGVFFGFTELNVSETSTFSLLRLWKSFRRLAHFLCRSYSAKFNHNCSGWPDKWYWLEVWDFRRAAHDCFWVPYFLLHNMLKSLLLNPIDKHARNSKRLWVQLFLRRHPREFENLFILFIHAILIPRWMAREPDCYW